MSVFVNDGLIRQLTDLWEAFISVPAPSPRQFGLWIRVFGFKAAEYGIDAAALAYTSRVGTDREINANDLPRYASGCMRNFVQREAK